MTKPASPDAGAAPDSLAGKQRMAEARAGFESSRPYVNAASAVCDEVLLERISHIDEKGYDHAHDDKLKSGILSAAAINRIKHSTVMTPASARQNLVQAASIIVAEIERLDRAALKASGK